MPWIAARVVRIDLPPPSGRLMDLGLVSGLTMVVPAMPFHATCLTTTKRFDSLA